MKGKEATSEGGQPARKTDTFHYGVRDKSGKYSKAGVVHELNQEGSRGNRSIGYMYSITFLSYTEVADAIRLSNFLLRKRNTRISIHK